MTKRDQIIQAAMREGRRRHEEHLKADAEAAKAETGAVLVVHRDGVSDRRSLDAEEVATLDAVKVARVEVEAAHEKAQAEQLAIEAAAVTAAQAKGLKK